ncbi:MAG: HAMP domain-containing histidine kinase [Burkholderiales bacterium]|nr:HAMP domain-containing histidine kinase [Burkholderiales bacterium]
MTTTIIPTNNKLLPEINEIIELVNKYNTQQLNIRITEIAQQVAHDIISPLSIIDASIDKLSNTSPNEIQVIRDAIHSVKTISHNLLAHYTNTPLIEDESIKEYIIFSQLIEQIIAFTKIEWQNPSHVKINYTYNNINPWIFISTVSFKHHLSNLLNNALDAIDGPNLEITINLTDSNEFFNVTISDNGIGVDQELIKEILSGKSLKTNGNGLINSVHYFEQNGGCLFLNSEKGAGTQVLIYLPIPENPKWFTNILVIKQQTVVIIDDDVAILSYWQNILKDKKLECFRNPDSFLQWYSTHSTAGNIQYLIDHDLNHELNGLNLFNRIQDKSNCVMITNKYSHLPIQQAVIANNTYLIPKFLLGQITISII